MIVINKHGSCSWQLWGTAVCIPDNLTLQQPLSLMFSWNEQQYFHKFLILLHQYYSFELKCISQSRLKCWHSRYYTYFSCVISTVIYSFHVWLYGLWGQHGELDLSLDIFLGIWYLSQATFMCIISLLPFTFQHYYHSWQCIYYLLKYKLYFMYVYLCLSLITFIIF